MVIQILHESIGLNLFFSNDRAVEITKANKSKN